MNRRSLTIVAAILTVTVCVLCLGVVGVTLAWPSIQTALTGAGRVAAPTALPPAATTAPATSLPPSPIPQVTPVAPSEATRPANPAASTPPAATGAQPGQAAPPATSGAQPALATPEPDIVTRLTTTRAPDRDMYELAEQLKKTGPIPRQMPRRAEPYKVGDKATFWVNDQSGNRYYEMVAVLRYMSPHVHMWVEEGVNVSDDAIRRSGDIFEKKIYPTTRQYFGEEASPGIDGDTHLVILNGKIPDVGGYFSSADTYPRAVNPYSNEREMFYINIDAYPIGTSGYEGTLAHEFQHMIHNNWDKSEDSWINEGFSELAARLNGYGGTRFATAFLNNPNTQLTTWSELESSGPHYGGAYLFASYLFDRFGADFIKAVVKEKALGIEGIENVLRTGNTGLTFEQLFADWVIANYLDNPQAGPRYSYPDIDVKARSVGALDKGATREAQVAQYGAEYIRLTDKQPVTLAFEGVTTNQVIPTKAKSGEYFVWSNRRDNMASHLTRPFDLSGVTKATLQFDAWYDIEVDYDYGYVLVSTDNGKTWDTVKATSSTDTNPNGSSYGWAFTGGSGDKNTPRWIEETADLTAYAGKKVLLRFAYITDDAVNNNGLAVDTIRIPELNYREDFEQGDGGWQAGGWHRTNSLVPQRYLLQLIERRANTTTVTPIPVEPDGKARVTLDRLGDVSEAVLVVSGLAPVTTQKATYTIKIE